MTARRLKWMKAGAVALVAALSAIAGVLGDDYPFLGPLTTMTAAMVGKLLGVPINAILEDGVGRMKPDKQVDLTVRAVKSLPVERSEAVTKDVLEQIAGQALRTMPSRQAKDMTKNLLRVIPPNERAQVLERIVFISSHPPPLQVIKPPPPSGSVPDKQLTGVITDAQKKGGA